MKTVFKMLFVFSFLSISSIQAYAYVACNNVTIDTVQSSSGSGFHGMSKGGAVGALIFVPVDVTKCTVNNSEDLSNGAFLVIDDYGTATNSALRSYWASMLLTAKASGRTVTFHSSSGGGNNWGAAVLKPYFLMID